MKVKLINDDWSNVNPDSVLGKILLVGDPLPVKGQEYTVSGFIYHDVNGVKLDGYILEEFDYESTYGILGFLSSRFEVITDSPFVPNTVTESGDLARSYTCYASISLPLYKEPRLPRKLKKRLKKANASSTLFVYEK